MPDVAKLKKRALEYEQKKQFDKALDTYTQVLAELDEHVDEADVALYNRVGDLLLRRGDVSEAVDHYEKAVDLYTDGGFFNNAIALCNKILRNAPGRNSVYYKLGKISARKGFINDAKQNFLEYADRMQKSGQLEEAFRALKEFADLCPDQDDIRLMLADQLVRKDRKSEAIEQLHALYDKFSAEGRSAEARATVDRMKALDPALEPKEVSRARAGKGRRSHLPRRELRRAVAPDHVERPPSQSLRKSKTQWTVEHPDHALGDTRRSHRDAARSSRTRISCIDLEAAQSPDVVPLSGLSHGALLPDGDVSAGDDIVSDVDVCLHHGIRGEHRLRARRRRAQVTPLEGLEPSSHLELPDDRCAFADADVPSMLAEIELETTPPFELSSPEIEQETPSGGELPMLDVPFDEVEDDGASLGGSLTFLSIESEVEISPLPEIEPDRSPSRRTTSRGRR